MHRLEVKAEALSLSVLKRQRDAAAQATAVRLLPDSGVLSTGASQMLQLVLSLDLPFLT